MSEPTVESLQTELKAAQTALDKASKNNSGNVDQDRLAFLEGDNKKMIEARDKAKEKTRRAEEDALIENGKFKELSEAKSAEVKELIKKIEGMTGQLDAYTLRDEEEFKAILQSVPEALRDQVSDETLPLGKRLSLAKALSNTKQPPAGYRQPGEPPADTLQAQYEKAVESKNLMDQLRLKREIHEAKE